jgi:hypothetical protein
MTGSSWGSSLMTAHFLGACADQESLCRISRPEMPKSSGLFHQIGRTFVRRIGCCRGCPETTAGTDATGRAAALGGAARVPPRVASSAPGTGNAGPPLADGYQVLGTAESCAAQDVRRPAVLELVADIAARDRGRTLPELHHFARRLGVPA